MIKKSKKYKPPILKCIKLNPEEAILSACTKGQDAGVRWDCPDCGNRTSASGS